MAIVKISVYDKRITLSKQGWGLSHYDGLHGNSVEHSTDAEVGCGLSNLDVTLVTPLGTPWIADDEIVLTRSIIVSPADCLHGMIDCSRASVIIINAWSVATEGVSWGMKGHRGWAVHKGSLEARSRSNCWDGAWNSNSNLTFIILALCVIGDIGIGGVWHNSKVLYIGVALSKQSSVTAHVTIAPGAINKLLFSEDDLFAVLDGVVFLDGSNSRERPAAAALALIFNGTDSILGSPVNWSVDTLLQMKTTLLLAIVFRGTVVTQEHSFELLLGQVRELVEANSVTSTVLAVFLRHEAESFCEDLLASLVLLLSGIALAMLSYVSCEGSVDRVKLKEVLPRCNGAWTRV